MCHFVLILPLAALPVFWIWPLPEALPAYGAVLSLSVWVYWYAIRAMRQPEQNGAEAMIGETGRIVVDGLGETRVQIRSELWSVASSLPLHQGDRVRILAAQHTRLTVQRLDASKARTESLTG